MDRFVGALLIPALLPALLLALLVEGGCASRSTLHADREDAAVVDVAVDVAPETWSYDASGPECLSRPTVCQRDDFGAIIEVTNTYEECARAEPRACGDLTLVFDPNGCLLGVDGIVQYSPAFVACVEQVASANRWICADSKSLHMTQACAP